MFKVLLGPRIWALLHRRPRVTAMSFIRYLQARARKPHADLCKAGRSRGRPPTPDFVVDAILAIKRENPAYCAGHIARMISGGEIRFEISEPTVRRILKVHGFEPGPGGKNVPRELEPGWSAIFYSQVIMAIDFKQVFDLRGRNLYILTLIDHGRRVVHWSRATYNPTAVWVAQQIRNAVMEMDKPPEAILLDRSTSFGPLVKRTLPAMGIKPLRTAKGCPWQNGVVERYQRTLQDDLLRYVQPINEHHLNRLLTKYRRYYNTARPHMANEGEPPIPADITHSRVANDPTFFDEPRKLVRQSWLGGLHSSYRWAT